MDKDNANLIHTFIRAMVESSNQLPFTVKHRNGTEHTIISPIHLLFVFPFGTGKSSLASKIPNSTLSLNHTEPSIIGSISREGNLVKSDLINAANGVYVMDEAHRLSKKAIDAMLSLLEDGYYSRSLGFALKSMVNEGSFEKNGWEITTGKSLNKIGIRVRFACGAFCEKITSVMQGAFLSRFAIFTIKMEEDDLFKLMKGEGILKVGEIAKKYPKLKKQIIFDTYDDFVEEYRRVVKDNQLGLIFKDEEMGYLVRAGAHLAKLSVHFARMKGNDRVTEVEYKKALKFAPLLIRNLKESFLTPNLYKIYDMYFLNGMKQADIAFQLGVSRAAICKNVKLLKQNGFINQTKEQVEEEKQIDFEEGAKWWCLEF